MALTFCLPTMTTLINLMLAFLLLINQGGPSSAGRPQLFWVAADKAQCSKYSNGSDCDTLAGHQRRKDVHFSLSNTTWIFLHGEHEVGELNIVGGRNVTLKGEEKCAMATKKCVLTCSNAVIHKSSDVTFEQLRVQADNVHYFMKETRNFTANSVDFVGPLMITSPIGDYTIMDSYFTPQSGVYFELTACPSYRLSASQNTCNFTLTVKRCKMEMAYSFMGFDIIMYSLTQYHTVKITIDSSTFTRNNLTVKNKNYPMSSLTVEVQNVTFDEGRINLEMPLIENSIYPNMTYPVVADEWLGAYVYINDCNFFDTRDGAMSIQLEPNWFQNSSNQGRVAAQHPEIVLSHSYFQGYVFAYRYITPWAPSAQIAFNMHTLHVAKNRTLLTILHNTFRRTRQAAVLHLQCLHGYRVLLSEGNQITSSEGFGLLLNNTQVEVYGYNEISVNNFTSYQTIGGIYYNRFSIDKMGGGIYLSSDSQLLLTPHSLLNVSANKGNPYGGGIYNSYKGKTVQTLDEFLDCYVDKLTCPGWCFFQFIKSDGQYVNASDIAEHNATVILSHNTATLGGNNVFNGHFPNCSLKTAHGTIPVSKELVLNIFHQYPHMDQELTPSFPYVICLCDINGDELNCIRNYTLVIVTYPVQQFPIFVTVLGDWQRDIPVTVTLPQPGPEKVLDIKGCTKVHTLEHPNGTAPGSRHELPLKASLRSSDAILHRILVIDVFNSCSPGLQFKDEQCVCNQFLKQHHFTCTIRNNTTTYKAEWSYYWIRIEGQHVILSPSCPIFFCNSVLQSGLTLDKNSDDILQCINGRRGLLCSECPSGYSSVFGSFKCKECSSVWLLQLPLYALGGIFIVALLFLFNLTLLQGTIMGVVLYTNIMGLMGDFLQEHAWGPLFFLLSVLNLQSGAGVCFYNGMDEFWKALLQFAFPFYIFSLLIVIIIVTLRCHDRLFRKAHFIAMRAVPVLATIMVLTYTSLVNAVITPLRYTTLYNADTAQGQTVWLYQPSLPFFGGQHLVLGILSIAVTVLYLIPFTFTMLFGNLMRRYFHKLWFSRFMDVLHGGFKWPLGFWIGLRLLLQVILMAINISSNQNVLSLAFSTLVAAGTLLVVQLLVKPFRDPNQFREDIHIQGPPSCKKTCLTWIKKFFNTYHAPLLDTLYLFNIALMSTMVSFGTNSQTVMMSVVGSNILIVLALVQFAVILVYHAYNFFPVPERARSCAQSCWSTMRAIPSMLKDTHCCRRGPREEEEPRRSPIPILILRPPEFDESYESESEPSSDVDQPPPGEVEVRETSLLEPLLINCD